MLRILTNNPWELYSSMPGWEDASAELDATLKDAIRKAHLARADGASRGAAENMIYMAMNQVMRKYANFGALDSEPVRYLDRQIQRAFDE